MTNAQYRWVIVASGGLLGCVAIGSLFALPVFLRPIAKETGWSMTGISTAMTIAFVSLALASFAWGNLSDRIGPRAVVLTGSVATAVSLFLASRSESLFVFQLTFGLCVGASVAAIFAPMMAAVTGWFETHRSLAVSLVSAGIGIAPLTMSPLAAWLISHHDWRSAMLAIAAIAGVLMVPTAFLIRRPPSVDAPENGHGGDIAMSLSKVLRSPQFIILVMTNFFCCATHSGPIFHTVSYAVSCGIPLMTAVTIYSVEGLAGLGGRIVFGVLGDRLGAKRVLVSGLLFQAVAALGYLFANGLATFYTVAALFGFIYAGVMPLYSVIARENFPLRMMGTVIGGTTMAGSLGMASGPIVGGMIYDHFASYSWLFVTSSGLGLGAFLLALTFEPHSRVQAPAECQPSLVSTARGH